MVTKTQVFTTREIAYAKMLDAYNEATALCVIRNADDPDLNEVVTYITNDTLKYFLLTRPDTQEGIQEIYYYWV